MRFGLEDNDLERIQEVFSSISNIDEARLYGSRAKGNYKPFSDVDITLKGDHLTHNDLMSVCLKIDDLLLPYIFDISIFKSLKNQDLIDHIQRRGISIYKKAN